MESSNHSEVQKPGIIEVHRADVQNSPLQRHGSRTSSGSAGVMESDNEEKKHGQRPPPLDISAAQGVSSSDGPKTPASPRLSRPGGSGRTGPDRGRKIGHRRVGQGGEVTYKKIQTSQIMGSIQLGIGHAVGGLASKPERDLLMQDFMTVETTYFPSDGSSITPAHHYSDFRFKNYAPIAFRYFRDLFGIQPDDFLLSLCNEPLIELSNPGASGSIFYLSSDDEFIIKTVQHKEGEFLQKLLPGYYMNLTFNPRTLLPKFFGLYCYQCNSKNVRIVVMNNLLPTTIKMHEKYDLKGSTYKRKASKFERSKNSPVFKDLDFMEIHSEGIMLEADTYSALMKTIQRDCRVLESFKIMDYSLLVGIHNLDLAAKEEAERRKSLISNAEEEERREFEKDNEESEPASLGAGGGPPLTRSRSLNRQRLVAHSTALESIQAESEPIDEEEDVPPGGIPARNSKGERLLLFIGIIDILQSYRLKKKLEHTFKAMIHDGDTVSVHRPGFYSQRFQDFMAKRVFKKVPSLDLPEFKGKHRKFRTLVTSYIALKHSPSKKKVAVRTRASTHFEAGQGSDGAGTSQDSGAGSPPHSPTPVSPPSSMSQPHLVQHHPINLPAVLKDRVPSQKVPMGGATGLGTGPRVPPPVPPRSPRRVVIQTPRGIPASDRDSLPSSSNTPPPGFDEAVGFRGIRPPSPSPLPLAVKPRPVHATDSPYHRTQVLVAREDRALHSPRSITPTLRTSHAGSSSWSSHVEAIRSNFERTASTNSSTSSQSHTQTSSVDHNLLSTSWMAKTTTIARSSISEIRLETRTDSKSSNLSGESGVRTGPTATPTWTEGTPSFTESSSSGDLAGVGSPARSVSPLQEITETITYHEGEMTHL